jgi:glycosyltransferase involved in cell wall biosynthesis
MKTYKKRVLFFISSQHLIPHGGLGSFAKSFTEMASLLNWKVDIALDKKPMHKFSKDIENLGANLIYPEITIPYDIHNKIYSFSDCINFEQIVNFRRSAMLAFKHNLYDLVVCNTQESMSAMYSLDLTDYIPIVFYTHQPRMVVREQKNYDVFLNSYHVFYNKHLEFDGIIVGTQSERNKNNLISYGCNNVEVLPMPMSERGLLEFNYGPREGVLYIGRYEPRKNPEAFLKVIQETGLPARVLTNKNGAKKFESEFKRRNITNYKIGIELTGQEKVSFIQSCKVHFNPSYSENYPFAFYECLSQMPCVVLDTQDWADNFDNRYYVITNKKNAAKVITNLYHQPINDSGSNYVNLLDKECKNKWKMFIDNFKSKQSFSSVAKINNEHTIKYSDFVEKLNRDFLSQEDIVSVLSNRHKFNIIYTDKNTYLTKDESFIPLEKNTEVETFFEFES